MKTQLLCAMLSSLSLSVPAVFAAGFQDHLGIQMWSLRETAKEDPLKAFDLVKSYGLKEIETAGLGSLTAEQYASELKSRGLVAIATHAGYEALQKNLAGEIATAKTLGAKYIVCPWIPHDKEKGFTEELAREVAANFNAWGKTVRKAGLKLGWHPHGFEFVPSNAGGGETRFDLVVRLTEPENLVLEMDVFWVVHAGQDPVNLLKKYGSRWALIHVKDMRQGAETGLATGGAPATDNVAVGAGRIDWKAVIGTAQQVGTRHYILEDETTAPLTNIPQSVKYLRGLKL
jgi:sugar phosphate isomerase/epimerase